MLPHTLQSYPVQVLSRCDELIAHFGLLSSPTSPRSHHTLELGTPGASLKPGSHPPTLGLHRRESGGDGLESRELAAHLKVQHTPRFLLSAGALVGVSGGGGGLLPGGGALGSDDGNGGSNDKRGVAPFSPLSSSASWLHLEDRFPRSLWTQAIEYFEHC